MASPSSKVVPLQEAIKAVTDGSSLTAGGFAHSHQPMAFLRALIRDGRSNLTLIGVAECWVAEIMSAAGMLKRAYMSNFMLEGFGRCRAFSRGVETGAIEVEDHSHFGILSRMRAAGLGLPFMPIRSMAGTDILAVSGFEPPERKFARMTSPFGPEIVTAVSALAPDVAIIHAPRADRWGNVQMLGTTSVIEEQARAARTVIVTVEEIVDTDLLRRAPEMTLLPGLMVDAIVHLPFGAHPTGCYGYYDHDYAHLKEYYAVSHDARLIQDYLERFAHRPGDHWAYLDEIGMSRPLRLRTDPHLGYLPGANHG